MDPTDGNIVPSSPEQVTWRSASEVWVHRQTLQNKKNIHSHQTQSVGDDDVANCCHGDLVFEITSNGKAKKPCRQQRRK